MQAECQKCNKSFDTIRPTAKYCTDACRMAAYRERKGIVTKKEKEYETCQRPGCTNPISPERNAQSKYCSSKCNKAVYNHNHKDEIRKRRLDKDLETRLVRDRIRKEKQSQKIADDFLKELMGE